MSASGSTHRVPVGHEAVDDCAGDQNSDQYGNLRQRSKRDADQSGKEGKNRDRKPDAECTAVKEPAEENKAEGVSRYAEAEEERGRKRCRLIVGNDRQLHARGHDEDAAEDWQEDV